MAKYKFHEGQHVIVTRLGPYTEGKYKAIIRGVAASYEPHGYIWIVEMVDRPIFAGPEYMRNVKLEQANFSCFCVPEPCIDFDISL